MRMLAAAMALALLGACATATPYQPSATATGYGYSEQQIEPNRARVSFRGNTLTDREQVETYLLFRAAELTVAAGFDHFVVANRDTDATTRRYRDPAYYPRFRPSYWYYSPRWGWRSYYDPFFDPFYDPFDRGREVEVTRYEAVAEVAMFNGPKPANNEDAYDAREVIANLQASVVRPAPAP